MYYVPVDQFVPIKLFSGNIALVYTKPELATQKYHSTKLILLSTSFEGKTSNTGFRFVRWTNANGETVSTVQNFTYTKREGHEQLTANFVFDPDAPADPAEPRTIMYYKLALTATEGGSVYGGGSYLADRQVTLQAYCDTGFDFVGWFDGDNNCLSTSTTFNYTTTAKHVMLTGRFVFNPNNPSDPSPSTLKPKHNLTATCSEGGSISWTTQRLQEGQSVTLTAYTNDGYSFLGWYLDGELYTTLSQFSYTVTSETVQDFDARWEFTPDSPTEPGTPTTTKHAFFLMNKVTKPGATVKFPIYLSSVKTLTDMTFQLEFPEVLTPDFETVEMSEKSVGYSVSYTKVDAKNYVFTLTGGTVPAGNAALLVFTIHVADDIDNDVDALDAALVLQYVAHKFGDENTDFIIETANVNDSEEGIDALDASLILQHAAKKIDLNTINETE